MDLGEDAQAVRRIAIKHKDILEDACRFMECARALLRRTDVNPIELEVMLAKARKAELDATQRAIGHVEPRKRFKGTTGTPQLEGRASMCLFVDESGSSAPHTASAPAGHSVFAVGAIAMTKTAQARYIKRADELKRHFFGHTEITFHEPFMRLRSQEFHFKGDSVKQDEFLSALRDLLKDMPFVAFGAVIRKDAFESEFLADGQKDKFLPVDAYSIAIAMLLERFVDFLAHSKTRYFGRMSFESQSPKQDALHQHSYATVLLEGTRYISNTSFMHWLQAGCEFVPKMGSHPVELADILSRDLHEWGHSGCTSRPAYWDIFSKKVYCRDAGVQGTFGFKVFPATGCEEAIYQHRQSCGAKLPPDQLMLIGAN